MDSDKENIYLHPNTGLKNRAARRMANNLRDTSCNDLPSQQSEFGAQLTSLGYSIQPHLLNQSLPSNTSSTVNSSSDAALIALAKLSQMVETVSPTSSNTAFTHSEHYHSSSIEALNSSEGITSDPESLRFTYTPMENVKKKKDKDQPAHYRDQDRFLPTANVGRMMKIAIPQGGKISKDAKECMQECASEFISFITSEAAERCLKEKRKTLTGEDILFAMATLGFDQYIEPLKDFLTKYKEHTRGEKLQVEGEMDVEPAFSGDPIQQLTNLTHRSSSFEGFSQLP